MIAAKFLAHEIIVASHLLGIHSWPRK